MTREANKDNKGWTAGREVRCPCCNNVYDTEDSMPFSPAAYDLYAAAPELLAASRQATLALASLISDWEQLTDYDPDNDPGHGPPPGIAELAALRAAIAKAKGEAP